MSISEIHHVALTVSDIERSAAFYRDALGFRKVLDMKPTNRSMPGCSICRSRVSKSARS